jgi:hypothetical protein
MPYYKVVLKFNAPVNVSVVPVILLTAKTTISDTPAILLPKAKSESNINVEPPK